MRKRLTRRQFLAATAGTSAGLIAAPYVSGVHAAGSLTVGLWDHWVPGANDVALKIINEWGEKEKVDVKVDFITSQGNKLVLALAAESQAKSGHDIMEFTNWEAAQHNLSLEPVDDLMKDIIGRNGPVEPAVEYLAKFKGRWTSVPMTRGTLLLGVCTRYDLLKQHAGIDIQEVYPAGKPAADKDWTWDNFLVAAEKCHKAGCAFGLPLGVTTDTMQWVGALFLAYGANVMDENANVTVKTDAVKQVLEYGKRLAAFLPNDAVAWDDASNNKWLISGKGALIFNPPSAWAVAKRDAPQIAEKCWTHGFPSGPKGHVNPILPRLYGNWSFSKNKSAVKSLLFHLSSRENAEKLVAAGQGYDIPPYTKFNDFKTWADESPPKGTLYHYPNRGSQVIGVTCSPAPPLIAAQIWAQAIQPKMIVRYVQGEPMQKTLEWAESELEGFRRT
jgi:ABC-type glycerol-3-phosphate transport system substrate-binding protein